MASITSPTCWARGRQALPRPPGGARSCSSHETVPPSSWSGRRHHGAALQHRRAAAVAASAAAAPLEQAHGAAPAGAVNLQPCGLPNGAASLAEDVEVDVTGTARHLGLEMEWQLSFAADGSFVEHVGSPHLSCSCGYDAAAREDGSTGQHSSSSSRRGGSNASSTGGGNSSSSGSSGGSAGAGAPAYFQPRGVCWSSDDGGCPRLLQLDDAEAQLLCMWVRTGLWVLPHISAQLDIARATAKEAGACAAAVSSSSGGSLCKDEEAASSSSSSSSSGATSEQLGPTAWIKLRLRGGGKLTALVEVSEADWRPLSLRLCLAGEHEIWRFSDWHQWQPGLWLAGGAVQSTTGEGGVVNDYSLAAVQVRWPGSSVDCVGSAGSGGSSSSNSDEGSSSRMEDSSSSSGREGSSRGMCSQGSRRFAQPPAPLMPPGASFVPGLPEEVPAWHTSSGHSLVRPLLNGREVGYFILDTGASGFVLDPAAGDALGLEAFGELQVTSIVGRIASRYRRADTFQLGPLRMARPLLMELPMAGLVTGVPDGGRVVGIVGYDVLRRAVVHVPAPPRRPPPAAAVRGASVDSPAAAVAASVAAAQLRRGALPFTLRFQHPEAAEHGDGPRNDGSRSGSISTTAGVDSISIGTACPPAAGPPGSSTAAAAAAAAAGSPEGQQPEAASSSQGDQQPVAAPASCLLTTHGVEAALAAELAVAATGSAAGTEVAAAAAAAAAGAEAPSRACGALADGPVVHDDWLPVVMVASLPHVELELVTAEGRRHRGLFMVDSGAGGLDIVLNARAAQALGMGKGSTATHIKGLGGSGGARMPAQRCQLGEVWLGQHSFTGVQALYREGPGGSGGLELSQHTSGIVCGGVLGRCALVFDYPRMRMAVRRPAAAAAAAAAAEAG